MLVPALVSETVAEPRGASVLGASVLAAFGSRHQPVRPASGPAERLQELVLYRMLYRRRLGLEAYVGCCLPHGLVAAGRSAGRLAPVDVPGLAQRHSDRPEGQPQHRSQ
ncbi:MAG: hypothetical protein ACJ72M_11780 [Propionibacteriaceae bacterium]